MNRDEMLRYLRMAGVKNPAGIYPAWGMETEYYTPVTMLQRMWNHIYDLASLDNMDYNATLHTTQARMIKEKVK